MTITATTTKLQQPHNNSPPLFQFIVAQGLFTSKVITSIDCTLWCVRLQEIIGRFAKVPEPEFPGCVVLEQYQAQVSGSPTPDASLPQSLKELAFKDLAKRRFLKMILCVIFVMIQRFSGAGLRE